MKQIFTNDILTFSGNWTKRKRALILSLLLFPVSICYLELVFRFSTVYGAFHIGILYTMLFSLFFGILPELLCSISKNPRINRIIKAVLLFLLAIPYLVEFFVYRAFKIYYDVNTITGGAGDAMGGFAGDIFRLIFCFDGLIHILLFLLPFLLYVILGRFFDPAKAATAKIRIFLAGTGLIFYLLAVLLIHYNPVCRPMYTKEYNYQSAVSHFGLLTGIRLDLKKLIFSDKNSVNFETIGTPSDTIPAAANPSGGEPDTTHNTLPEESDSGTSSTGEKLPEETTTVPEPIYYGKNILDIDFTKLATGTSGALASLDTYVASLPASSKNKYTGLFKGKNLIFLSAEAFCAEVIDPDLTPTLYRLATKGINFTDYYQPASAGTTGGEYNNLMGLLPTDGGMSMKDTAGHLNYMTMGNQLNRLGYYGKAFHNNDYTYYDRDKTHINLGYSDGFMGYGNGMEKYVTNVWPQSDLEMIAGTLPTYIDKQPFNIYYMTVSGHGLYSATANSMTAKHWDEVKDFPYSDPVKSYLAAQLDLEAALTCLVNALEEAGIADDTVICLSADHFPYGLDNDAALGKMPYLSELYGYNVTTNLERDHNRLILWCGCLEDEDPIIVDTPVSSLDVLPTLSNLFGIDFDSRLLPGRDVFSDAEALVFNLSYDWKTELGTYTASTGTFTPAAPGTVIPDGYIDRIKATVRNKITYCESVLNNDYYAHVFKKS